MNEQLIKIIQIILLILMLITFIIILSAYSSLCSCQIGGIEYNEDYTEYTIHWRKCYDFC